MEYRFFYKYGCNYKNSIKSNLIGSGKSTAGRMLALHAAKPDLISGFP